MLLSSVLVKREIKLDAALGSVVVLDLLVVDDVALVDGSVVEVAHPLVVGREVLSGRGRGEVHPVGGE